MLFYVSHTQVKTLTSFQRERLLPYAGEVLVRRSQPVTPEKVIARTPQKISYLIIPLSQELGVPASDLPQYLMVKEEDQVEQGQPLAEKKGSLGSKKIVKTPLDGIIAQISRGRLILQKRAIPLELRAMMTGEVVHIYPQRGAILETKGSLIQAIWDSGRESAGKISVLSSAPDQSFDPAQLTPELRGTILVAGYLDREDLLRQAEENGVRGLIVGGMPAELCRQAANLSYPIFITDGIHATTMSSPIFTLFQQSQERTAALFTRIPHQPQSRPEIVIPLLAATLPNNPITRDESLTRDQTVRINRVPYLGQIGQIINVYNHPRTTMLGSRLPGADVQLANGQILFVPYTNLDLIS